MLCKPDLKRMRRIRPRYPIGTARAPVLMAAITSRNVKEPLDAIHTTKCSAPKAQTAHNREPDQTGL